MRPCEVAVLGCEGACRLPSGHWVEAPDPGARLGPGVGYSWHGSTGPRCSREAVTKTFYLYLSETVLPLPKPKGFQGPLNVTVQASAALSSSLSFRWWHKTAGRLSL